LKLSGATVARKYVQTFNRTIFGIEILRISVSGILSNSFNRTIFGIEMYGTEEERTASQNF